MEDRGLAQGREQEQDEGSSSCQCGHNIYFRTKIYLALHVQLHHVLYFLCSTFFVYRTFFVSGSHTCTCFMKKIVLPKFSKKFLEATSKTKL